MTRNVRYSALVLRSRPSGESNRDAWLLTGEAGIIRATVFGGPKSKLRAFASPFHSGQACVYQNPAKEARKLSDFDVQAWRPGLRESYERIMAADAVVQTVLESHGGGGNWGAALALAEGALDALALADGEACSRILVCFLWQWAGFLGLRPPLDRCCQCAQEIQADSLSLFSPVEGGVVCNECIEGGHRNLIEAGPGCKLWLDRVRTLPPSLLNRFTLDKKSFSQAKSVTTAILAEAFGKRLESW